jgi:hypothetical protein
MPSRTIALLLIGCLLTTSGCGERRPDPAIADRAEAAFRKLGGVVVRDDDAPGRPLVRVDLGQGVNRRCRTVTDADLRFLDGLETLEALGLAGTGVTDAGLGHVRGLKRLRWLDLDDTAVTDTGLGQLHELAKLEGMHLHRTEVSEVGVAAFQQTRPAVRLEH